MPRSSGSSPIAGAIEPGSQQLFVRSPIAQHQHLTISPWTTWTCRLVNTILVSARCSRRSGGSINPCSSARDRPRSAWAAGRSSPCNCWQGRAAEEAVPAVVLSLKQFDTSGKSPAYCHRRKNRARGQETGRGLFVIPEFCESDGGANRDAASSHASLPDVASARCRPSFLCRRARTCRQAAWPKSTSARGPCNKDKVHA